MVIYKNNSSAELVNTESEAEKPEFINLDEISKGASQRRNLDPQVEETVEKHMEQGTPTVVVCGSTRTIRSP